jgi:hypothetical protein
LWFFREGRKKAEEFLTLNRRHKNIWSARVISFKKKSLRNFSPSKDAAKLIRLSWLAAK